MNNPKTVEKTHELKNYCQMKKILVIAMISILPFGYCQSQIIFQNNLKESVYVAFARFVMADSTGFWVTKGWSTVNAGSSIKAFDAIGTRDSVGYFVITRISETPYPGTKNLLVHPTDKFLIKYADSEESLRKNPDSEWRAFRLVQMQPGKTSGIISFSR
jgi:hypothetical protein